jgi:hypothetical protein
MHFVNVTHCGSFTTVPSSCRGWLLPTAAWRSQITLPSVQHSQQQHHSYLQATAMLEAAYAVVLGTCTVSQGPSAKHVSRYLPTATYNRSPTDSVGA